MSEPRAARSHVPKVRPTAPAENAPLQAARVAAGGVEESAPLAPLARAPARGLGDVRPAREAWELLCAPLYERKGIRIAVYGITGKGKTTAVKDLLAFIRERGLVDLTIVHDVKFRDVVQYEGETSHDPRSVLTPEGVPEHFPATVVLRKRGLDHMPSVDQAARVALEAADQGLTTMLVVDEFARALDEDVPGGFRKGSTNRIACEGFGLGSSLVAMKQLPQFMPSEVRAQSELILLGMAGDGLTHLVEERAIPSKLAPTIAQLPVGHFVIKPSEGEATGIVYKVPAP